MLLAEGTAKTTSVLYEEISLLDRKILLLSSNSHMVLISTRVRNVLASTYPVIIGLGILQIFGDIH